jgi:hypothetical protein
LDATNVQLPRSDLEHDNRQASRPRANVVCFSPSASLGVAAGIGLAGAAALARVSERREIPLAAVPLLFSAQQAIEGSLWLALGNDIPSRWAVPLANAFMVLALVIWPLWSPVAAMLVERDRKRRIAMTVILIIAILLAVRGVSGMSAQLYEACVVHNSISYSNGLPYLPRQFAAYVLCVCFPYLLSSHTTLRIFGAIVSVGLFVAASLYTYAYVSVWCFFAAAGSLTIYLHFARANKEHAKQFTR